MGTGTRRKPEQKPARGALLARRQPFCQPHRSLPVFHDCLDRRDAAQDTFLCGRWREKATQKPASVPCQCVMCITSRGFVPWRFCLLSAKPYTGRRASLCWHGGGVNRIRAYKLA